MEQVVELIPFLRDPKKEARTIAIQNLASFSSSPDAQELLVNEKILIPTLKILLSDIDYIAREAYVCFLQFSTNTTFAHKMLEAKLIPLLMEVICDKESKFIEVALLILGNLTRIHEGSELLLQKGTEYEGVFVYKLINKFYEGKKTEDAKEDKYKWIASIVTNLSQLDKGREIFTKDSGKLLLLIASANISNHSVRKRGIAATIKNCCFERKNHLELLNKGILNFIVVPFMANPEDFTLDEIEKMPVAAQAILMKDHTMETDREVTIPLLESLILLCSSIETREFIRESSIYAIVREFDKKQEDEEIKETVLKLVELLVRDENTPKLKEDDTNDNDEGEDLNIKELTID